MCSRTGRLLLAAALLASTTAAAQQPALERARADSLLREWRQANTLAAVQDSMRHAADIAGRDTVRAGALTILVNPSPLPVARAAARAWAQIDRFYGTAGEALARQPLVLRAIDPDTTAQQNPGGALPVSWDVNEDVLAGLFVSLADLSGADPTLHDWLGGALVPSVDTTPRRALVYVELVTAPSQAVRRCFGGDRSACRDALSLAGTPDLLTRWYGPDERRFLATVEYGEFLNKGPQAPEFRSCAGGSDSACLHLLESLPSGSLRRPLSYAARFSLLQTARALGGAEMFHRLFAAPPGPMGARLAAAAGVSEDSLVGRWRTDVLAARPTPVPLPPWGIWVALGWTVVFMALGLGSSRWRVS
jgi:hypothetical protein